MYMVQISRHFENLGICTIYITYVHLCHKCIYVMYMAQISRHFENSKQNYYIIATKLLHHVHYVMYMVHVHLHHVHYAYTVRTTGWLCITRIQYVLRVYSTYYAYTVRTTRIHYVLQGRYDVVYYKCICTISITYYRVATT